MDLGMQLALRMGHTVVGLYSARANVEASVEALNTAGYAMADIYVLSPHNEGVAAVGGLLGGYESRRCEGWIRKGGTVLSVRCDDHDGVRRARSILEQTGAEDVSAASRATG